MSFAISSATVQRAASQLDQVALNPQPLPPRASSSLIDWCGTVPKRFPPPPPPPLPWMEAIGQGLSLHPLAAGGVPGGPRAV